MNKFVNLVMVGVLILTVLAGYWYVKPDQMPQLIGDLVPALKVRAPQSPMSNFRAPRF